LRRAADAGEFGERSPQSGRAEIVEHFFKKAGREWENCWIVTGGMVEAEGAVAVECRYDALYKPTGRALDAQVCHVWRLREGKVTSFHQYLDTARLQEAMGFGG